MGMDSQDLSLSKCPETESVQKENNSGSQGERKQRSSQTREVIPSQSEVFLHIRDIWEAHGQETAQPGRAAWHWNER